MTDHDPTDAARQSQHFDNDDHGRDDLCGGLGYAILFAGVVFFGLAYALARVIWGG